jgi:hypothetical protein
MSNVLKIAYQTGMELQLAQLNAIQGDLKELTKENRSKLRSHIEESGFAFAPHVWHDSKSDTYYLVDGHQRVEVLKDMLRDGWEIGPIPVVPIDAKDIAEARNRVLQSVSQFGHVTNQGIVDFAGLINIDIETLGALFDIPGIDFKKLADVNKPVVFDEDEQGKEVTEGEFSKLIHTCPRCNFQFGAK